MNRIYPGKENGYLSERIAHQHKKWLIETADIAAALGHRKGNRLLVCFAAETENGLVHARAKLKRKKADLVVLNDVKMEGAGFEVINLGVNNDSDAFLDAVREHDADILGMSALLTTTMPYMGVVIKAAKEAGLREKLIVMVGGAPLNAAFAEDIEADAYCRDAAVSVDTAKKLIALKLGQTGV